MLLALLVALDAAAQPASAPPALEARIDAAFEATFPLYEMARVRFNSLANPLNPAPGQVNGRPVHLRALADHTTRQVTAPNNDTLYSGAWLDVRATPVRLSIPRIDEGRYWSVALHDAFTNNFAILGRERDGTGPVEVVVVGPQWRGARPAGRVIRAPSNDVQVLGRILIDGPADAPAVHRIQDAIRIAPLDARAGVLPQRVAVRSSRDPENYLTVVNEMLSRNPPPKAEAAAYRGWTDLGIGGGDDAFAGTAPAVQSAWRARLPVLHERLREGLKHGARRVQGWSVPSPAVGNFGKDHALRAAVAFGALGALDSREAIYLSLDTDPASGAALDGRQRWRLIVPPIEARGFWSLSMYEMDAEGRLFFAANPLHRYAIGDRTRDLERRPDGSIELLLQPDPPADPRNWLPTPAGPMALMLRIYGPSEAMRGGEAPLPRLVSEPR